MLGTQQGHTKRQHTRVPQFKLLFPPLTVLTLSPHRFTSDTDRKTCPDPISKQAGTTLLRYSPMGRGVFSRRGLR